MSTAANKLAVHLSRQVINNPDLAYQIGPYTQTWELLLGALAAITGETRNAVEMRLKAALIKAKSDRDNG